MSSEPDTPPLPKTVHYKTFELQALSRRLLVRGRPVQIGALTAIHRLVETATGIGVEIGDLDEVASHRNALVGRNRHVADWNQWLIRDFV